MQYNQADESIWASTLRECIISLVAPRPARIVRKMKIRKDEWQTIPCLGNCCWCDVSEHPSLLQCMPLPRFLSAAARTLSRLEHLDNGLSRMRILPSAALL